MLFALISRRGVVMEKRAFGGDIAEIEKLLEAEKAANPDFSYKVFSNEDDPEYKEARLPEKIPPIQEQLDAIWKGGAATEAMRTRMQPFLNIQVLRGIR